MNDSCDGDLGRLFAAEIIPQKIRSTPRISETLLASVIEREIIPRLFLAHCSGRAQGGNWGSDPEDITVFDAEALTRMVLGNEPTEKIVDQLQLLIDGGVSLKRVYLDLLAPIARKVGELWEQDRCTFLDVTLSIFRLHWILREVGRRNGDFLRQSTGKRRIWLAPVPGEQHVFGLLMVEEFFVHAGWGATSDHTASVATILSSVASQDIDVVGFSISREELFDPMLDLIARVREVSLNRDLVVMVGGMLFRQHPEFASRSGSANVVFDGAHAVETAENLVEASRRLGQVKQP